MSFKGFIVSSVATLCLLSCASDTTRQVKKVSVKSPVQKVDLTKDSAFYLKQAKQNYADNGDIYQRNSSLILAAETLQTEQECKKSIRMLKVLQPELQDKRLQTHSNLILAECYLILSDEAHQAVAAILANLEQSFDFQSRIAALQTQLHVDNKEWLLAARSIQNTDIEEPEKTQTTWQWIKKLDSEELEKARLSEPTLQPWLQLAIIVKRFALDSESFEQQLVSWQTRHYGHPLVANLPAEIEQALMQSPIPAKRVAILLPLTGRLAVQGLAIKEGVLAAYLDNLQAAELTYDYDDQTDELQANTASQPSTRAYREIRFFDSAAKTTQQLNELVTDFDVIIGPLIKEQIEELTAVLPADKILLALNRVESKTAVTTIDQADFLAESAVMAPEHYYFSLAPEDEAQQLALYIRRKQLVRPIIFAADNPVTRRMAEAFIHKWLEKPNAIRPDLTIFTNNKDMRIRVSEMLDVSQSENRIEQIERLADVEVFGVERNRRDIDAIVLFADHEQTSLLNPIIEASLSPFARKSLSVFASSRSHSLDLNSNNLRDLRNLTFTDMPWMLPEHKWQGLAKQTKQLWPQRQDALQRLFAMGFDAYNLLPNLRTLKKLPQTVTQGLTGEINVDDQGILYRRLPLAQVARDRVKPLAMD